MQPLGRIAAHHVDGGRSGHCPIRGTCCAEVRGPRVCAQRSGRNAQTVAPLTPIGVGHARRPPPMRTGPTCLGTLLLDETRCRPTPHSRPCFQSRRMRTRRHGGVGVGRAPRGREGVLRPQCVCALPRCSGASPRMGGISGNPRAPQLQAGIQPPVLGITARFRTTSTLLPARSGQWWPTGRYVRRSESGC